MRLWDAAQAAVRARHGNTNTLVMQQTETEQHPVVYVAQGTMRARVRLVGSVVLVIAALVGGFYAYRTITDPMRGLAREKAAIMAERGRIKSEIETHEATLKQLEARYGTLVEREKEVDAAMVAEANRGVRDPRPIKVDTSTAFQPAGT